MEATFCLRIFLARPKAYLFKKFIVVKHLYCLIQISKYKMETTITSFDSAVVRDLEDKDSEQQTGPSGSEG